MATIDLDHVRKVYAGGVEAVTPTSFQIADGELIVLVGPSGCGKSTVLRMIAGLETVTDGEIRIGGARVNEREPAERDIAMVFQNYALYPHMSVYDNLAYGLRNRGVAKADIDARVREAAKRLEIESFLTRKPRQLSGGQRQRVAMGRAIVRDPAAFLFDEPLSNLDAKLRVQMRVEIKALQRQLGTTSVYVTHDQLEAMTLADRLVVMSAGRIEQIGAPLEVYERPASAFVAGFIGSPPMNLIPADTIDTHPPHNDGATLLGIRPEHLRFTQTESLSDGDVAFALTIAAIEPVGAEAFLHGLTASGDACIARTTAKTYPRIGETVTASVDRAHCHFFDKASGRRIEA